VQKKKRKSRKTTHPYEPKKGGGGVGVKVRRTNLTSRANKTEGSLRGSGACSTTRKDRTIENWGLQATPARRIQQRERRSAPKAPKEKDARKPIEEKMSYELREKSGRNALALKQERRKHQKKKAERIPHDRREKKRGSHDDRDKSY